MDRTVFSFMFPSGFRHTRSVLEDPQEPRNAAKEIFRLKRILTSNSNRETILIPGAGLVKLKAARFQLHAHVRLALLAAVRGSK